MSSLVPWPEEEREAVFHVVNLEIEDLEIIYLHRRFGKVLTNIYLKHHPEEKWNHVFYGERPEYGRSIATFSLQTRFIDSAIDPVVVLERGVTHLYDWLVELGVVEVEFLYAGMKTNRLKEENQFSGRTEEANYFLDQLKQLKQITPDDISH